MQNRQFLFCFSIGCAWARKSRSTTYEAFGDTAVIENILGRQNYSFLFLGDL
jgi:hypothetical protein